MGVLYGDGVRTVSRGARPHAFWGCQYVSDPCAQFSQHQAPLTRPLAAQGFKTHYIQPIGTVFAPLQLGGHVCEKLDVPQVRQCGHF